MLLLLGLVMWTRFLLLASLSNPLYPDMKMRAKHDTPQHGWPRTSSGFFNAAYYGDPRNLMLTTRWDF